MVEVFRVEAPEAEPLALNEANFHLRLIVDFEDTTPQPHDVEVAAWITTSREAAETYTGRAIAPGKFEAACDRFEDPIRVLPVRSVESVEYVTREGDTVTVPPSVYRLMDPLTAPRLRLQPGQQWPHDGVAVHIQYTAGYGGSLPLPGPIRSAMLLLVGHLYENREETTTLDLRPIAMGWRALLDPYRLWMGV